MPVLLKQISNVSIKESLINFWITFWALGEHADRGRRWMFFKGNDTWKYINYVSFFTFACKMGWFYMHQNDNNNIKAS